ncbi:MAG: SRPBCC domain-containing protein [Roseibium sp.]|uniref:SRPBCC family protein n=1 Tax=Roseibium sp. TaxID=1936156 RepID=UPI00262C8043|nr:SRPBCC domain-containing protein [Roseibium sp.]MCV0426598.1 SRPBCC domain-containing protein [Roseibium sp.]
MSVVQIDLAKNCSAPAVRLWEALLAPRLWWGEGVLLEPVPGGKFYEPWQDNQGQHHTHGRVVGIEAPAQLILKWWDDDWSFETDVIFQVSAQEQGSRVRLLHTGWEAAPEAQQQGLIDAHRQGWAYHLGNLVTFAGQQS